MDIYAQIVEKIISEQETIIGIVALEQAKKVNGLNVNWQTHTIEIKGNGTEVVDRLIEQYKTLFGQASIEACREAVSSLLPQVPQDKMPNLLK